MPTDITTETSPVRAAENARAVVPRAPKVIEVNKVDTRQQLSSNGQSVPPAKESQQSSNQQQLEKITNDLNKHVQSLRRDLHFSLNEETGDTVISVIDTESQKVIRTIPSDEFLSISQQFNQSVGLLLSTKV